MRYCISYIVPYVNIYFIQGATIMFLTYLRKSYILGRWLGAAVVYIPGGPTLGGPTRRIKKNNSGRAHPGRAHPENKKKQFRAGPPLLRHCNFLEAWKLIASSRARAACGLVLQFFSQRFNVVTGLLYRLGQATSYEFNKAACHLTPDPWDISLWSNNSDTAHKDQGSSLVKSRLVNRIQIASVRLKTYKVLIARTEPYKTWPGIYYSED